jgi:hypothetical protein
MNPHAYAAIGVTLWTVLLGGLDALLVPVYRRELRDAEITDENEIRHLSIWFILGVASVALLIVSSTLDALQGTAAAVAVVAFALGAARDVQSQILWPEVFQIALAAELLLRAFDGHAYEAAIGCAAFGATAWALVTVLQVFGIPQGSGDTLPVFLIGASFPIQAGVTGVSLGFIAYTIFVLLTRTRPSTDRTLHIPMGPAFALTSVAATILTTTFHYG